MEYSEGCSLCGEELVYKQVHTEKKCSYCGAVKLSNVECPAGHFVCDECHQSPAMELIEKFCIQASSLDPMKLAVEIMKSPRIKMHGPEHHYLVPAVLIAAYYNYLNKPELKKQKLGIARRRSESVPGGYCGSHGTCGAAIGVGVFVSVILESTPLSEKEWSTGNRITGEALLTISQHGGPRCCKRDSFLVIRKGVEYMRTELNLNVPISDVTCQFYERNKQCRFEDCPFYPN